MRYCPQAYCQSGQCYFRGSLVTPATACASNATCQAAFQASCQTQDYQRLSTNIQNINTYNDRNLQLFVKYEYIARACNVFACSRSSVGSLQTSPIDLVANIKATPICSTNNAVPTSYVDFDWTKPNIVNWSGVNITSYQIQYRLVNPGEVLSDCVGGTWTTAAPACDNPAYNNQTKQSCRESLTEANNRYQHRKEFHVYRLRAVGDRGSCVGGSNDGTACTSNAQCTGGGTCQIYVSSWACTKAFRVCPVESSYQEQRPN